MSQFKKIFTSFVSLTTIVWSVGAGVLVAPTVASAATISAGDLIKASGPAVYYYAADQKRYVFPNEMSYKSWFADFSTVKTITDAELAAIMIGGNVTMRPGTKLVKITTDPKTYAVTKGGVLHWIESEAVATALYGANWAQRVVDVPDAFFVNYTVGSSIPTAVHPDGTVIAYTGSTNRYVVWGGAKRMITDAGFGMNNFNQAYIVGTAVTYSDGTQVTGREADLADVVAAGGGVVVGGNVTVALASDTPAGMNVPKNAASVQLAKFNLTAGSAAALVTGLRIHRVGVGATTDFSNVYLYDGAGNRLTSGRTINSQTNLVEFNGLTINIAAGQTYSVVIQGDFSSPPSTGGQHSFEIVDAASVVVSAGTVGGSFPVRGNVFTVGTSAAARVDVQKGTQPTNPNIGQADVEISNFKLVANTNDVEIRRITLLQAGTITNTDLSDLKLYQGTTLVASVAALVNDKIVLNFSPAYLLTNGTTKVFSLHATVGGRAARTITTYVEYTTDVYAVDKIYNAGAAVDIATNGTFDGTGINLITVTTQGGQLTVAFNGPTTANLAKGTQGVSLFKFSLTSSDSQLEIKNLDLTIAGVLAGAGGCNGNADCVKGTAGTEYFRNIKIVNADTGATLMGPLSLPATLANSSTNTGVMHFADSFYLNAGQTVNLAVRADLYGGTEDVLNQFYGGTHSYRVTLADAGALIFGASDVRLVSTGEYLAVAKIVPNSTITGNPMTIKASSLDVSLASTPSSGTMVKKQTNIPSVGFVLSAGAQSDMTVTAIKLTGAGNVNNAGYALADLANVISSCALFDGATQVGVSQSPDVALGTMNITNMSLSIPKGTSKTLILNCTADSVVSAFGSDLYSVGIRTAATDVTAQDGDGNTVTPTLSAGVVANSNLAAQAVIQTVKNSGTLTFATDALRSATILVADGSTWQNMAQFKATAQYEAMTIDRLTVTSTGDAANFMAIAVAKDGAIKGSDILPSGMSKYKDIDLTTNPITVPKDGSVSFQLWGKLANVQSSSSVNGATVGVARTGSTVALGLAGGIQTGEWDVNYAAKSNIRVTGAASGERVYTGAAAAVSGNSFVTRKSKPTVTRQALSSTTISSGQDMDLFKFQVSADAAGSVSLKKFMLSFSKSTSTGSTLTLNNFKLRRGSTDFAAADIRITDGNFSDLEATAWPVGTNSGQIVVTLLNEDSISGSGNVYTLHATIGGAVVAGDTLSLSFYRTSSTTPISGYITTDFTTSTNGIAGPSIDLSATGAGTPSAAGTFVWSDQSEVPHSAVAPGSKDWTDDIYVDDLTATQSLTR